MPIALPGSEGCGYQILPSAIDAQRHESFPSEIDGAQQARVDQCSPTSR